jgi:hypothetical protein
MSLYFKKPCKLEIKSSESLLITNNRIAAEAAFLKDESESMTLSRVIITTALHEFYTA